MEKMTLKFMLIFATSFIQKSLFNNYDISSFCKFMLMKENLKFQSEHGFK